MNGQGGFANERLMCPPFLLTCHGKQAKQCVPDSAINGLVRAATCSRMRSSIKRRRSRIVGRAVFCSLNGCMNEMVCTKLLFPGIAIGGRGDGLHRQSLPQVRGQGGLRSHQTEVAVGEEHGFIFHHRTDQRHFSRQFAGRDECGGLPWQGWRKRTRRAHPAARRRAEHCHSSQPQLSIQQGTTLPFRAVTHACPPSIHAASSRQERQRDLYRNCH